jgi:tetratricopeptide (TPR) repeat protein
MVVRARINRRPRRWYWLILPAMLIVGIFVLWRVGPLAFRAAGPSPTPRATPAATLPPLSTAIEYYDRANEDFDRGDYGNAVVDYGRAIELKPEWAEAYNNRAYTYMKVEDYPPALDDLNEAIRLRPDYINALLNRGDIYNYYYNINYELAIADYNTALAVDPSIAGTTSVCGHRAMAEAHNGHPIGIPLVFLKHDNCASPATPSP